MERISLARTCLLLCCLAATRGDGETRGVPVTYMAVKEDSYVVLNCSLGSGDIRKKVFDWKKDDMKDVFLYDDGDAYGKGRSGQAQEFIGRVSHFDESLAFGNASIKINKAVVADSGNYTCISTNPREVRSHISLTVECILKDRTKEKKDGAAAEPTVKILNETNDWSLLQCVVRGARPKPKVEWQDTSGNIVPAEEPQVTERGGSYDIIFRTTVTRSDTYRCVSTQEEINHQIHAETYVHISGAATEPYITTRKTDSGMMLQCVARDVSPQTKVQLLDSSGNFFPAGDPQVSQRGGSYDITLLAAVTKSDTFRCVVTHPDNSQTSAEIDVNDETSSKVIIGVVGTVGVIGMVIGVIGIVYGLKARSGSSGSASNSVNKEKEDVLLDSTQQP